MYLILKSLHAQFSHQVLKCAHTMYIFAHEDYMGQNHVGNMHGLCGKFNGLFPDEFTDRMDVTHPLNFNPAASALPFVLGSNSWLVGLTIAGFNIFIPLSILIC